MHLIFKPPSQYGTRNGPHWYGQRQGTINQLHQEVKYHCGRPSGCHDLNNKCGIEAGLQSMRPRGSIKHFSPKRSFPETRLFGNHRQEERTWLFLCPGDLYKTDWVHQLPTFEHSIALFPTAALEGGNSYEGWVTPLYQDIRV